MAATEPMLRIREEGVARRRGRNVWLMWTTAKKFISKALRTPGISTSEAGTV